MNYQVNNVDNNGLLNVNILASTNTFGHITFNVSFYKDRTARTFVRGFEGLKMFFQGNVKDTNTLDDEGVPSFD